MSRRGTLNPLLLFLLLIFILLFAFVLNISRLWLIKIEANNNADATSAAAAQVLVDDDLLRGFLQDHPEKIPELLVRTRMRALEVSKLNPVNARVLKLRDNPNNLPDGDIVFGSLDRPADDTLTLIEDVSNTSNTSLKTINTVRITIRLMKSRGTAPQLLFPQLTTAYCQGLRARASATLDRFVIGFRHAFDRPIPVAPIALFGDFGMSPATKSWQAKIEAIPPGGSDDFRYDRPTGKLVPKGFGMGDKLPEFTVSVPVSTSPIQLSAATGVPIFVGIGPGDIDKLNAQLANGITKDDFETFGAPFELNSDLELEVTANQTIPDSPDRDDVVATLLELRDSGSIRIWPLYTTIDAGMSKAIIQGFVAARVASVVEPVASADAVTFTVQPTMLATHAAVTDANRMPKNGIPILNPYICKVRFVE